MRRSAVTMALVLCGATSCTERLVLPQGALGGGAGATIGDRAPGSGGTRGGGSSGGRAGTAGGIASGGGESGVTCTRIPLVSSQHIADLVLMVGRDTSMANRFIDDSTEPNNPTPTTRMVAVQGALHDLLMANHQAVNFGYLDFPAGVSTSCPSSAACCANAVSQAIPTEFSFSDIDMKLHLCETGSAAGCVSLSDARPVADVFRTAGGVFASLASARNGNPNDQYAALIIDGPPSCVAEVPQMSCGLAQSQLNQLLSRSINVRVVTVGQDAEQSVCLQDIAQISGSSSTPDAYQARAAAQLRASLGAIVAEAAHGACVIDILSDLADPSEVVLTVEGSKIPRDPTGLNGWKFVHDGASRIVVQGDACQTVQRANRKDVVILTGCSP